jgi:RNA polymerase sigma-70 factor (sigma-E family)
MVEHEVAFRDFVLAHSTALLRTGWLLTGNWSDAEDLLQTALTATWPHWADLQHSGAATLYVRKVMLHRYLHDRRRRWKNEIPTAELPVTAGADPYASADLRRDLARAMAQLPPRQRAAITLRYFADLSEAQCAQVMGCSTGAVKSNAAKGLRRLRTSALLAGELTGDDRS